MTNSQGFDGFMFQKKAQISIFFSINLHERLQKSTPRHTLVLVFILAPFLFD